MKQYPALEQLLGGYLHEDWADDYADFLHAIDAFVEHQPSYAPAVPGEIAQLLGECGSDAVLEQRL
ncbi:contact-dependent growth inhibition system immunity protein, partial [Jatrophihabitans sp.]|uniref:contact-dependent growth inhibition system immunity protein n=1 Tax=Jatrophihabitans sp. TaxID=1932789 RepID=UPI002F1BCC8B